MRDVRTALDDYRFNDAASAIYQFVWHEFCDWYLEWIKPDLFGDNDTEKQHCRTVLLTVLETVLKLLHPFTPFVTEEIWQALPGERSSIMLADFPESNAEWQNMEAETGAQVIMGIITGIRNIRSEMQIHPSVEMEAIIICPDETRGSLIAALGDTILTLTRCSGMTIEHQGSCPRGAASYLFNDIQIIVPLAGLIDAQKEIAKLTAQQQKLQLQLEKTEKKLANQNFIANAPAEVVDKEREKQQAMQSNYDKLEETIARLKEI